MKKVAFFGGSFDPIHLGHLNLAIEIFEKSKRFDEILFCPTNISPFKLEKPPKASFEHRLNMLKIALKNAPFFKITSSEIKRDFPSYTIDTLNLLKDENDLNLILTEESLEYFHLWKEYENILKIAPLIVGTRKKNIDTY
ncbi:MAG: adenylyltransferase/cytidyltransferase family protein, partial [Parachlamydiales bacterium]|nr:adenylyltransferase/cytidyltransferase family protein [Parachlamydiales bacterium]